MSKPCQIIYAFITLQLVPLSGATLDFEFVYRNISGDSNSEDFRPSIEEDEIRINKTDCEENTTFTFKVSDIDEFDDEIYLFIGDDCDEEECEQPISSFDVSHSYVYKKVHAQDLLCPEESDCDCSGTGSDTIWLAQLESESDRDDGIFATNITLKWDMDSPVSPSNVEATVGEEKVQLNWDDLEDDDDDDDDDGDDDDDDDDDDIKGVVVIYSAAEGESAQTSDADENDTGDAGTLDETNVSDCSSVDFFEGDDFDPDGDFDYDVFSGAGRTSATISGLSNGQSYQFGIVAYDSYYNFSDISDVVCAKPSRTVNFLETYSKVGGQVGEFCFIATAVFGSYDHPIVRILRKFRDSFLKPLPGGISLIKAYYAVGPIMADSIGQNGVLTFFVQILLILFALFTLPLSALGPGGIACLIGEFIILTHFGKK